MTYTANQQTGAVTVATTVETVVISSNAFTLSPGAASTFPGPYQGTIVRGFLNVTPGTTSTTVRVRQGTASTGTLIGNAQTVTTTANSLVNIPVFAVDSGTLPTSQYCITLQNPSGTTQSSTVSTSYIETDVAVP